MEDQKYWYPAFFFAVLLVIIAAGAIFTLFIINYPPEAPRDLNIEQVSTGANLEWADSFSQDVVQYNIYRSRTIGDVGNLIAETDQTEYLDFLTEDGVYYYIVKSFDGEFESENNEQKEFYYDLTGPEIHDITLHTGTRKTNTEDIMFYFSVDSDATECQIINITEWFPNTGIYSYTLNTSNNSHSFDFICKDKWGNTGPQKNIEIIFDNTPPTITKIQPDFFVAEGDVVFIFTVDKVSQCTLSFGEEKIWEGEVYGNISIPATIEKTNYVFSCIDEAGNTEYLTGSVEVKLTDIFSLIINNGESVTNSRNVDLDFIFTPFLEGITCEVYNVKFVSSAVSQEGEMYSFAPEGDTTLDWEITSGYGRKYVFAACQLDNRVVGTSIVSVDYKKESEDSTPPSNTDDSYSGAPKNLNIKINNGEAYTNSLTVYLTLNANYATDCAYKTKPGDDWSSWSRYATSKTLFLPYSENTDTYTVYYKCKNRHGESNSVSDSIIFDDVPPGIATYLTADYNGRGIYLSWKHANDAVRYDIYRMAAGSSRPSPGTSTLSLYRKVGSTSGSNYEDTALSSSGYYYYYIVAIDRAENRGEASETISAFADVDAPEVRITSPSSGSQTTASSILFSFVATDNHASSLSCSAIQSGAEIWSGSSVSGNKVSFTVSLSTGQNTIKVGCSDEYHTGQASISILRTSGSETQDPDLPPPAS